MMYISFKENTEIDPDGPIKDSTSEKEKHISFNL